MDLATSKRRAHGTITYQPPSEGSRGTWIVDATPHVAIKVKRLLPRVQQTRTGAIHIIDSPETARDLEWINGRYPMDMDAATRARLTEQADQHRDTEAAVIAILGGQRLNTGVRTPAREPYPEQLLSADLALRTGRLLITDEVGLGKAQPLDSLVLTPTGHIRMGDISVGSSVIAADGTVTAVTAIHPQGERDCYRVTFSDGATVECSDDHLWKVRHHHRTRSKVTGKLLPASWSVRTLRELMDRGLRSKNCHNQAKWHIPMITAPDLDNGGDRPLNPYLLGVLLGDGGFTARGVAFSSADEELVATVQEVAPEGIAVRKSSRYTYRLADVRDGSERCEQEGCDRDGIARRLCGRHYQAANVAYHKVGVALPPKRGREHPVIQPLRDLGLWGHLSIEKFVPESYKLAPVADRLALLQGLMDTDGYAMPLKNGNASAFFYSSSGKLASDVQWLVESLGGTGRVSTKVFQGRVRYTVTVKLPQPFNPFRLSRKAKLWGCGHFVLRPTRAIVDVEYVGRKPMQCISVAHPEQLYVTDRFVITHNTFTSLLVLRAADALPALVVTLTHLPKQWIEKELARTFPDLRGHIVTSTTVYDPGDVDVIAISYSKLAAWSDYLAGGIRTVIFDEVQELRHAGTAKYNAAAQISDKATYRVGLSATPVYNYGGEAFNVLNLLAPDALGSREEFLREWGQELSGGKIKVRDPKALGEHLRAEGLMIGHTREQVGRPLPQPIVTEQNVDADPQVYQQLAGDAVEMAKFILNKDNNPRQRWQYSGELDLRLRQATGIAKAPAVAEFCRMLLHAGTPRLLLWGWHRSVYQLWLEQLDEFQPVLYTGSETAAGKQRSVEAFLDGHSRILIMSLRSGAGLDGLQMGCDTAVFGELDWSPQVHRQCIGRLARDGIDHPPMAYFCVSDHGSDPPMAEMLNIKKMQNDPMVNPHLDPVRPAAANDGHIRALAQSVIQRSGQRSKAA